MPQPAPAPIESPPAKQVRPIRRSRRLAAVVNLLGFLLSSLLGLAIGYYVLCYVNPKGNFLKLPPNWFPWTVEQPVAGDGGGS